MLTEGIAHPDLLWWLCVGIPLSVLTVWGLVTLYRGRNELRW